MPSEFLKWLPAVVSLAGALTSVGGLAFTVYKGSREWNKWKRERHALKRAEVAAEVLVASLRFLTGLQQVSSPWITGEGPDEPEAPDASERERAKRHAEVMTHILNNRWEQFAPTASAFLNAWEHAEVFLTEDVIALMEEIWKARASISSNQHMHVIRGRQGGDDIQFFEEGFGPDVRKSLEELRNKAKRLLRPLAQMTAE